MGADIAKQEDREQAREKLNCMRVIGGLLLVAALLLYFFHLAELPMGRSTIGGIAAVFCVAGAVLLWMGWRGVRQLR